MALPVYRKQPAEKLPLALDYYGQLPPGTAPVSASVTAEVYPSGPDATAAVVQNVTPAVKEQAVWFGVQGGDDGVSYRVTVLTTLSDGSVLEDDILLEVTDA